MIDILSEDYPTITPVVDEIHFINTQTLDRNLMAQVITTYLFVLLLVSLGFFGVGTLASAQDLGDPMQSPPSELQEPREAK